MPVLPVSAAAGEPVVDGPCARWMTWDEVEECRDDLDALVAVDARNAIMDQATDLLYWMSGERYTGLCQETVLVCNYPCTCILDVCTCLPSNGIDLRSYAPVDAIDEIVIDGEALDSGLYAVRNSIVLRLDGERWPSPRDLTDPQAFQITFSYGRSPGPFGRRAAAAFAAELAAACLNLHCGIRANVRSVQREGKSFVVFDSREMIDSGYTGNTLADMWLAAERAKRKYVKPALSDPALCQTLIPF